MAEQHNSSGSLATLDLILLIQKHYKTNFVDWPKGTKTPDQFRLPPLKGLWKAHSFPTSLGDLAQNLANEARQGWFDKKLKKLIANHGSDVFDEQLAGKVGKFAVTHGIPNRGKRSKLTSGHWLVFSKTPIGVLYLCRAHHEEEDELIFERVLNAAEFFPNTDFSFSTSSQ